MSFFGINVVILFLLNAGMFEFSRYLTIPSRLLIVLSLLIVALKFFRSLDVKLKDGNILHPGCKQVLSITLTMPSNLCKEQYNPLFSDEEVLRCPIEKSPLRSRPGPRHGEVFLQLHPQDHPPAKHHADQPALQNAPWL